MENAGMIEAVVAELGIERSIFEEKSREFARLIADTNRDFNLTAFKDETEILEKLVLDSLAFLPALAAQARNIAVAAETGGQAWPLEVIDVGSGSGIPGILLALARPDWRLTCIEATGKKAAFIQRAASRLRLSNLRVVAERSEETAHRRPHRERYDAAVMRFVGAMNVAVELGLPFVKTMGWLWAVKFEGREAEREARLAQTAAERLGGDLVEIRPAPGGRVLLAVQKLGPSPKKYPRQPGIPSKRPISG